MDKDMNTTKNFARDTKNSIEAFLFETKRMEGLQAKREEALYREEYAKADELENFINECMAKQGRIIEAMNISYGVCFWSIIEEHLTN